MKNNILLDTDYLADEKLDIDGLRIDGNMHEIAGKLVVTGRNVTLKNIILKDNVKIVNNDSATFENCSFKSNKKEIIINNANLTLKNCDFKEKHRILNTGEVTLMDADGTEVTMDEIIELYEEVNFFGGLGALFGKPHKKRPKKIKNDKKDEEKANSAFRTLFGW